MLKTIGLSFIAKSRFPTGNSHAEREQDIWLFFLLFLENVLGTAGQNVVNHVHSVSDQGVQGPGDWSCCLHLFVIKLIVCDGQRTPIKRVNTFLPVKKQIHLNVIIHSSSIK